MGIRQAVGIVMLVASLIVLAYAFYLGAVKGMIGCERLSAQLLVETGNKTVTCTIPGPLVCDKKGVDAFSAKMMALKGKTPPSSCNARGVVRNVKIVRKPVDSLEADMVVAAWMGLIVGPWLAFGETPTTVGRARG